MLNSTLPDLDSTELGDAVHFYMLQFLCLLHQAADLVLCLSRLFAEFEGHALGFHIHHYERKDDVKEIM